MKVFWSVDEVLDEMRFGTLAIGNFDGIHLGHQQLMKMAEYDKGKFCSGVLTFSPHPHEILYKKNLFYLTCDEQRLAIMKNLSLDVVIIHRIDQEFLNLSPQEFVENILLKKLKIGQVIVGDDFTFGKKALGKIDSLILYGKKFGFKVKIIKPVLVENEHCSSSKIRKYLSEGNLSLANKMLGRPFSLLGSVKSGQKKGGQLGFKTANIIPPNGFLLFKGVYATLTRVFLNNGFADYLSATNVGFRPTVTNEKKLIVETHCLDQDLMLYGQKIEIFFIKFLRGEMKFNSILDLKNQVQKDLEHVRNLKK
jgi:riboflavin kinase / FMN adenylyltransferase